MSESRESLYEAVSITDGLAAERTFLAAERTLLAYARTSFALFVAGVTGVRLLDDPLLIIVGSALAIGSLIVIIVGIVRFGRSKQATQRLLMQLSTRR